MPDEAKRLRAKGLSRTRGMSFFAAQPVLDIPLTIIVCVLVVFGLIMLFSASSAYALYRFGDSYRYIIPQTRYAILGIIFMFAVSRFDYHILHKLAMPALAITIILLALALVMPEYNNSHRWITLGSFTFQPSELAKFAITLSFAQIISVNADKMKTFKYGVAPFLVILIIIDGLMVAEPHLSGLIIISAIGIIMMFVGGTGLIWFGTALGAGAAMLGGFVLMFKDKLDYAFERLETFQNPWLDPLGSGHQVIQSLYAIGSGGIFGRGIGNSIQKHLYLPEPQNDFIFAILCEELGLVGALIVIGLFAALFLRGMYIALHAKDKFGSMLIIGVIVQITLQAVLNIAVVTKTIPNTGISLPFFSAGGSSLFMILAELGVVLSVSRQSSIQKV